MTTRIAGIIALAALALAACGGSPEAQPTAMPGALAVAQTPGTRQATATVARGADALGLFATCTGKGELAFRAHHTVGGTTTADGDGRIACPGSLAVPGISLPAGARATVEITAAGDGVTGTVQLAPPQS